MSWRVKWLGWGHIEILLGQRIKLWQTHCSKCIETLKTKPKILNTGDIFDSGYFCVFLAADGEALLWGGNAKSTNLFFFLSFKSFLGNICKREMQLLILPFFLTFYYRICLLFHVFDLNSAVTSWLQIHTHGEELTVYSFFKKWKENVGVDSRMVENIRS